MADTVQMPPQNEEDQDQAELSPNPQAHAAQPPTPPIKVRPVFGGSLEDMEVKRDPTSAAISTIVNVVIIAFFLWFAARKTGLIAPPTPVQISILDPPPPPIKAPPKAAAMGGGGGSPGPTPVVHGNPPKFDPVVLNPPKAPPLDQPKIQVPVTVNVQTDLKMAHVDTNAIGMSSSPLVGVTSGGGGHGGGLGPGSGNGLGPGSGGNTGGGVERIGGGVSAPVVLYQPEPEFSEEARKAKVAGNVLVYLQVDENGRPQHVRVLRGIGLGLDEKAIEAVRNYKFKPAMKAGHPVTVEMNVEVNFQIF